MTRSHGSSQTFEQSAYDDPGDRRAHGERRRNRGLLELRARRDGVARDRRRSRSAGGRRRLRALWRLVKQ